MRTARNVRAAGNIFREIAARRIFTALAMAGFLGGGLAEAGINNPYDGYSSTSSYFLNYANGTSFAPGVTGDVQVSVKIAGVSHVFNVDTGSRGLYAASTELGGNFTSPASLPGAYQGQIQLDSSGRLSSGYWVPTALSFDVINLSTNATTTVTSTANILAVTTLSAQMNRTATFGVDTSVAGYNGTVNLVGGGTIPVISQNGTSVVALTQNATVNQQVSYAENIPGLIKPVSNFGIGFDLNGAPGGTGPVGNNKNQIYNPLINVAGMGGNGTLVAGYIVKADGIQLGLTGNDAGYGYTTLNPTIYSSTNSEPDWQTPMGQTAVTLNGTVTTNGPGSIVMDSGISQAYISAPDLSGGENITEMAVYLMNSGGAVGYNIDLNDPANLLNPSSIDISDPTTDGIYSQNQPPYQANFFNTGRNVFSTFNMLYDAQNGYMGVLPNSYGLTDPNVFFTAQSGGFPNPIPEGNPTVMILMGLLLLLPALGRVRMFQIGDYSGGNDPNHIATVEHNTKRPFLLFATRVGSGASRWKC